MPRYPRFGEEWGKCQTCGRNFPVSLLRESPRYGWQCLPGLWTPTGCYDGPIQRDEIRYFHRPGEGARKSRAPVTNTDKEGI